MAVVRIGFLKYRENETPLITSLDYLPFCEKFFSSNLVPACLSDSGHADLLAERRSSDSSEDVHNGTDACLYRN